MRNPSAAALAFLGILTALLGLFVAGNFVIVIVGLLIVFGAGFLDALTRR